MHDKLIHGYFSVDVATVWRSATVDAPAIKNYVSEVKTDIENDLYDRQDNKD